MSTVTEAIAPPARVVSDAQLAAQRIPVTRVRVATVGGGLGSLALASRLRIGGVPLEDIAIIGTDRSPAAAFLARCRAVGLAPTDRLRSSSTGRVDNPWGFPGYAAAEAWRSRSLRPVARVVGEGTLTEGYGPTVGQVQAAIDREARRIGWTRMTSGSRAEYLFVREGGGYFVVSRTRGQLVAIRCDHVHLALGPAGHATTPQAAAYRRAHAEGSRVVHAFDEHDHVYKTLAAKGGKVLVRGSGPASLRVLERLAEARAAHGRDVHLWQAFRSWPEAGRDAVPGFRHQEREFPRAAYGGTVRDELRGHHEQRRLQAVEELSATTVPWRKETAGLMASARRDGWYDAVVGEVTGYADRGSGVTATVALLNGAPLELAVDHVIEATGLDARADAHPLVADMLAFSAVTTNRLGGLRVDDRYAVLGGESGAGRLFASGLTALGAEYGPVDSFEGLQHAALTIAAELADAGIGHHLTPWRSTREWLRWIGGKQL